MLKNYFFLNSKSYIGSGGLVGSVLARVRAPSQTSKHNTKSISSLSRFLAKILRVNKIAMKSFSKNLSFVVDFKL